MKQRVAIARDREPAEGAADGRAFSALTRRRARTSAPPAPRWRSVNLTIVFITHDLEEAIFSVTASWC
jgi:ABC-type nitrate/sulfonate/bicarbonate transport system ATPase subunit